MTRQTGEERGEGRGEVENRYRHVSSLSTAALLPLILYVHIGLVVFKVPD